eukprot:2021548-Pyramimonas_sp.AAC.1
MTPVLDLEPISRSWAPPSARACGAVGARRHRADLVGAAAARAGGRVAHGGADGDPRGLRGRWGWPVGAPARPRRAALPVDLGP